MSTKARAWLELGPCALLQYACCMPKPEQQHQVPIPARQGALRAVVDRHEILRTCFVERDGEIQQAVLPVGHPDAAPRLRKRAMKPGSRPGDLEALVDELATQPYQLLSTAPPVRFTLLVLAPGDAVLVIGMHHIIRRAAAACLSTWHVCTLPFATPTLRIDNVCPQAARVACNKTACPKGAASKRVRARSPCCMQYMMSLWMSSDGWSWGVLKTELAAAYNALRAGRARPELPPLAVQYADFAAWQRARLDGGALEAQARATCCTWVPCTEPACISTLKFLQHEGMVLPNLHPATPAVHVRDERTA